MLPQGNGTTCTPPTSLRRHGGPPAPGPRCGRLTHHERRWQCKSRSRLVPPFCRAALALRLSRFGLTQSTLAARDRWDGWHLELGWEVGEVRKVQLGLGVVEPFTVLLTGRRGLRPLAEGVGVLAEDGEPGLVRGVETRAQVNPEGTEAGGEAVAVRRGNPARAKVCGGCELFFAISISHAARCGATCASRAQARGVHAHSTARSPRDRRAHAIRVGAFWCTQLDDAPPLAKAVIPCLVPGLLLCVRHLVVRTRGVCFPASRAVPGALVPVPGPIRWLSGGHDQDLAGFDEAVQSAGLPPRPPL